MNKLWLTLVPALLLTGCTMTAQECDPSSDPGFFNKIGCTVSGSYSERVETKEQDLKALQDENAKLKKLGESLSNEQALVEGSMAERQEQLRIIEGQVSDLRSSLSSKGQLSASLKQQLDDLDSQIAAMQNTPAQASILQKEAELKELEETYNQLLELSI